jgi:hypothetical protein
MFKDRKISSRCKSRRFVWHRDPLNAAARVNVQITFADAKFEQADQPGSIVVGAYRFQAASIQPILNLCSLAEQSVSALKIALVDR